MEDYTEVIIKRTVDILVTEGIPDNLKEVDFNRFKENALEYLQEIEDYERCSKLSNIKYTK